MKKMKICPPKVVVDVPKIETDVPKQPENHKISVVLECPYKECASSDNCAILDIIKKIPKKKESCSYFEKRKVEKKV